jgi:hypothetical protein
MILTRHTRSLARWTVLIAVMALALPAQALAEGTLEVRKTIVPAEDPGRFDLQIDGTTVATNVGDGGSTGEQTVTSGPAAAPVNHNVAEVPAAGSDLDPRLTFYTKGVVCKDANGTGAIVAQNVFPATAAPALDVPIVDGADVVCDITNTRIGIENITEYTANPEQLPNLQVPNLTQAGGHPNIHIYQRFCNRSATFEVLSPPAGCTPEQLSTFLKDFRLRLPAGMIGNPTAVTPCPYHLFLAFSCPLESRVGQSFTLASGQSVT